MPTLPENPCADGHPELALMTLATTLLDDLPVMVCNRRGERFSFEDAVRNDERLKLAGRSREIELVCSVCLYVRPRPGLSDADLAERQTLTVMNGHMVCIRHAGAAGPGAHEFAIRTGVFIESGDPDMTLEQCQDWRHKQDREPSDG